MQLFIYNDEKEMAVRAAVFCAEAIKTAQKQNKSKTARILLSTGASQLPFFVEFVKQNIDWPNVEMFHLDEYIGIDGKHPASFNKYLKERFLNLVNVKKAHLIDGMADPSVTIKRLTKEINRAPIDLALVGIGENAHIAFNDPPADFDDEAAFKVIAPSDTCKAQQVREKWFENEDEVCKYALTITCKQIMKCKKILSVVPYSVKAQAIYDMLTQDTNIMTPATLLKEHPDFTLMLDRASAQFLQQNGTVNYLRRAGV